MRAFLYFLSIGFIASCTYQHDELSLQKNTTTQQVDTSHICFSSDVQPIIQKNCAFSGCHDAETKNGGIDLSVYSIIVKNVRPGDGANSVLYLNTSSDQGISIMPPLPYNPLTVEQRLIIKKWIDEGASEKLNCN